MGKILKQNLIIPSLIFVSLSLLIFLSIGSAVKNNNLQNFVTANVIKKNTEQRPTICNQDGTLCTNDCNDSDPEVHPKAKEVCDNVDNNCNGLIDENCDSKQKTENNKNDDLESLVNKIKLFLNQLK